jgi:hypothetical protein
MASQLADTAARELQRKLKWLMGFRVLAVTVLLGSSILLAIGYEGRVPKISFYLLIGVTYLLTILYVLALSQRSTLRLQAMLQLTGDVLLETALILGTGGPESPFNLLYVISIIAAGMLLGWHGSIGVAVSASCLYSLMVIGAGGGWLGLTETGRPLAEQLYLLLYNVAAFVAVALLSSSLADRLQRLHKQLERQEAGLQHLQRFHEYIVQSVGSGLVTTDLSWRFSGST